MAAIAHTCPANQWPSRNFWCQIDSDVRAEVRVAAIYGGPIDMKAFRSAAIGAVLAYAIPAGNA